MTLEDDENHRHQHRAGSSRIKRCLFGASDPDLVHNQYSKMIREHLKVYFNTANLVIKVIAQTKENEWNFDFEDEAPTISDKARFKWERVR